MSSNDTGLYNDDDDDETPLKFNITSHPTDFPLGVLYDKLKSGEIVIPQFQRTQVWNLPQASRLIESFLMGLPIPPIYFYTDKDQKLLVIDGQQRLLAISNFFDNRFGDETSKRQFKLKAINKQSNYYDKSFNEFTDAEKLKLKRVVLRSIISEQLYPEEDDVSMYYIFERLNTGGTELKDQEVRNCIYHGNFNDLLNKLNEYPNWRIIYGDKNTHKNKKDVIYILRYMALYHHSSEYKKPIKDFLSRFMKKHQHAPESFLKDEEERFKKTCDKMIECLGNTPLNRNGSILNPSLFDAVFVAFAKNIDNIDPNIKPKFNQLLENETFQNCIGRGTTDSINVKKRLDLAEKMFD